MMPGIECKIVPCGQATTESPDKSVMLIGERFDLTPAKRRAMMVRLRQYTEQDDWIGFCLSQIEPDHTQAPRARALAEVTGKSERQCVRIIQRECDGFDMWGFFAAPALGYMTLRGAVEILHDATGAPRDMAEMMLRSVLGPERGRG